VCVDIEREKNMSGKFLQRLPFSSDYHSPATTILQRQPFSSAYYSPATTILQRRGVGTTPKAASKAAVFCRLPTDRQLLLENLAGAGTDVRRCSDALGPRKTLQVTNGQLSLEDAVAAISNKTLAIYKQLSMDEDRALIDADLALDTSAFKYLINVVSITAIRLIETEWITLHKLA
jgi:hypothetical protein